MQEATKETTERLWSGNKTKVNLEISLYGRHGVLHISKDVVRILGAPRFVSFRVNQKMDSIIIEPCEFKHSLSFEVPEKYFHDPNRQLIITSKSFVEGLMLINEMELANTYQIKGTYLEKNNVVVFNLAENRLYGAERKEA